ncbi:hypothetical protein X947_5798 [Burkholderia pseudomallei MSHR7334]|nr:hypothetical protein X947_5798 [Burkholderia pseudomallei MSHR7334]
MSTAHGARIAAASRGEFEPAATARRLDFAMIDPPPTDSLIVFECVLEGFRTPSRRLPKNLTFGRKARWNVRPAHAPAVHRPPMLQAAGPNGDRIVRIVGRAAVVRRSSTHRVRLGVERAPAHPRTRARVRRAHCSIGRAPCRRAATPDAYGKPLSTCSAKPGRAASRSKYADTAGKSGLSNGVRNQRLIDRPSATSASV